jgi:hypothetical protein
MRTAELVIYHVPVYPTSLVTAVGYVVSFVVFHERGFGVPSHRFFRSLLQQYHLELHNLTPLGILHIVTFVTLCEVYMGLSPISTYGTISSAFGVHRTQM